ncbi:MAG: endonuclease V [Saprospiraceae bacterium]
MKIVIDVGYDEDRANAASLSFENWDDSSPTDFKKILLENIADYEPGKFYLRELPCILESLSQYNLDKVDTIIIDGFVWLNSEKKPGLGAYLFENLENKIPIIGVAKRKFHGENVFMKMIERGESKNPLFITAEGIEVKEAAELIRNMHGDFRIPTLLRVVDQLSREW